MDIVKLKSVKDDSIQVIGDAENEINAIDDLLEAKAEIDLRITTLAEIRDEGGTISLKGNSIMPPPKEAVVPIHTSDMAFIDTLIALEESRLAALDEDALVYEAKVKAK